jgi:hypothetical protein
VAIQRWTPVGKVFLWISLEQKYVVWTPHPAATSNTESERGIEDGSEVVVVGEVEEEEEESG